MKKRLEESQLARRVAQEFTDGMVINLRYGMPSMCTGFIPPEKTVFLHAKTGS
jgi:acyl CoA:acetate/3-ketoacid CoA transferase beta subunit